MAKEIILFIRKRGISSRYLKVFFWGLLIFLKPNDGRSNEIADFLNAKKLPLPSTEDILGVSSAVKGPNGYRFVGTPTAHKYLLPRLLQVVPEEVIAKLGNLGPCEGRDRLVFVLYDPRDENRRILFRQICRGACVASIETVGRRFGKDPRPTRALSEAVTAPAELCVRLLEQDGVRVIDKTEARHID